LCIEIFLAGKGVTDCENLITLTPPTVVNFSQKSEEIKANSIKVLVENQE